MKRVLPGLVLALIVAFTVVTALHYGQARSWAAVHTGSSNLTGVTPNYNFWSGFGSDLGEYVIVAGVGTGLYHAARRRNCHAHGCWRIGNLPVGDPPYRVCKKHHFEITGSKPTIARLKQHHQVQRNNPAC